MHLPVLLNRSFPLFLLSFALCIPAQAQVFWSETFDNESEATSNWQYDGVNAGPSYWTWTDDPAAGYQEPGLSPFGAPTAANGYFLFNSDENGQTHHDVWITNLNRPADCTGKTGVQLRFYSQYIFFNPAGTVAQLGVSTNGVDFVYQNLFEGQPANLPFDDWVEVDLPAADDQPTVWLRFRWIGNYEYHWKIDDLTLRIPVEENPDLCETAADLTDYFGQPPGEPQVTPIFDNTNATVSATDPEVSCWGEAGPGGLDILNNTLWFAFTGDGGTYDIQTVPCDATNYIGTTQGSIGDTQMLVYAGDDCTNLTEVVCNDDLFPFGQPDWRAGVTLETAPGQQYYILIDGFESQGVAATGEFCIQITQQLVVPCSEGTVGTFAAGNNGFVCHDTRLEDILSLNAAGFVLPTTGEVNGLAWCVSLDPIPAGVWPGSIPNVSSTTFVPNVYPPTLLNNGAILLFGTYYLTPVVLGGGTLIDPGLISLVTNVDPSNGCFFTGLSQKIVLLPVLSPIAATPQITDEVVPPGGNGAIVLTVSGGSGQYLNDTSLYQYLWNNGATTKTLSGLTTGTYTVTVSDPSGCTAAATQVVTVGQTVGTTDPATVQALDLWPNPARESAFLHLQLHAPATVRVEVLNMLGQPIAGYEAGTTDRLGQTLDVAAWPDGAYWVRVQIGSDIAVRRLVVLR